QALLSGKTAAPAYREAYKCSGMLPGSIWTAACRLRNNTKVAQWLAAAKRASLGNATWPFDRYILALEAAEDCKESGNHGARIQARKLIGEASGHHTQKVDITVHDPLETLREIADLSPELAHQLAQEAGIDWPPRELGQVRLIAPNKARRVGVVNVLSHDLGRASRSRIFDTRRQALRSFPNSAHAWPLICGTLSAF